MRNWLCIIDFNIIAYIGSIAEILLILISGEGFPHISLVLCGVSSVIFMPRFGTGELRFNSTWFDQFICHQSYKTFRILHLRNRIFFSCLTSYNLYFHLQIVIFIPINFTIMYIFLLFYTSISTVSHYLLPPQLHPAKNSENVGSTYLQQILADIWIISNILSFIFNKSIFIKYVIGSSDLLLYHYL